MYAYVRNNPTTFTDPSGLLLAQPSLVMALQALAHASEASKKDDSEEKREAGAATPPAPGTSTDVSQSVQADPPPRDQQKETVVFSDNANPDVVQEKPGALADRTVDYQAVKMDNNGKIDPHDVDRQADLTLHEKLDPASKTKNVHIADKAHTETGVYKDYQEVPWGGSYRVLRDWKVNGNSARVLDRATGKTYAYEVTTYNSYSKPAIKTEYTNVPPF